MLDKILWAIFISLVLIIIGFFSYFLLFSKPKVVATDNHFETDDNKNMDGKENEIVKRYIDSLFAADLESVYDMLHFEVKTPLNTKEVFLNKYKSEIKEIACESINIVSDDSYDETFFTATYKTKDSSEIQTYEVSLIEDKIVDNNLVQRYSTLGVPKGYDLYIDDILIDESYIIPKDDERALNIKGTPYCFISIFQKGYQYKVTSPLTNDYIGDLGYSSQSIYSYDLTTKKGIVKELFDKADQITQKLYKAALEERDFNTISHYFIKNSKALKSIKKAYQGLNKKRTKKVSILKGIKFNNRKNLGSDSGGEYVSVVLAYDIKLNYTNEYGENESRTTQYEGSQVNTANLSFQYEDGKWLCKSLCINILFPNGVFDMEGGRDL